MERTRSVGSGDERSVGMLTAFGGRTHAGKNGTAAYFVFLKKKALEIKAFQGFLSSEIGP